MSSSLTPSARCALTGGHCAALLTDISLMQSPGLDHKSIIIPINLLYLQT